ncbi:MAG TPA: TraM recognition domain-containing protein [Anaeromyxobacteraceae bacterium]|nr:TraM recognition domain-containing protein [Anaeromyxobacteraceae bacterium]
MQPRPPAIAPRAAILLVLLVSGYALVHVMRRLRLGRHSPVFALSHELGPVNATLTAHPWLWGSAVALGAVGLLVLARQAAVLRNTRFTRRMTTLDDDLRGLRFPLRDFNPIEHFFKGPPGHTFVGLNPRKRLLPPWGLSWRPVYLSPSERSMGRHVLGKTGSGKTTSILWPQVLQDALMGRGVLVIDAKGSTENAWMMRSIANASGRLADLRVFSLPAWNRPVLFSHTYNLVHVSPRTHDEPGGDVLAMAERVFSLFDLGENPYFKTQAFLAFTRLCRLLHGMVDDDGVGIPFNLRDVSVCIRGLSAPNSSWNSALKRCLERSQDREAADEIRAQVLSLGKDVASSLSGLLGAVDRYQSPLVNAYAPDLVFEEVLEKNQLVYVQLPSNLFKIQAPALGKVMLMDLQQEASLRQVFRRSRNQRPFSVSVDEFGTFADLSIIDSLNKLRDANILFTLSHQSLADLELVSREFAQAVWDNTRTKDILALDSPELCERLARSLGTRPRLEHTVQQGPGALATIEPTGVVSTRAVEAYRLHPNRLKMLASCGQGFLFASRRDGREAIPVAYCGLPELPLPPGDALPRRDQAQARGLRLGEQVPPANPDDNPIRVVRRPAFN